MQYSKQQQLGQLSRRATEASQAARLAQDNMMEHNCAAAMGQLSRMAIEATQAARHAQDNMMEHSCSAVSRTEPEQATTTTTGLTGNARRDARTTAFYDKVYGGKKVKR